MVKGRSTKSLQIYGCLFSVCGLSIVVTLVAAKQFVLLLDVSLLLSKADEVLRRLFDAQDLNILCEFLAGKRMVHIEDRHTILDLDDGCLNGIAIITG